MNTTGFGTGQSPFSFGTPQQPAAAPLFGQQQQQQPSPFAFGAPQPQQQSAFRLTTATPAFGAPAAQPAFGSATSQANPFGATTAAPAFGAPQTGFGAPQPSAFGAPTSSAFGAPATTGFGAPGTGFGASTGFGAPSTGFGAPAANTGFGSSAFGAAAPSAFGTAPAPSFGSTQPSFSFPSTGTSSLFGGGFGATTTAGTGFPAPSFAFNTANQPSTLPPLQQQQPQQQIDPNQALSDSIFHCNKFGDERDIVLANFNFLQASLGIGKGYYSQTLPPVTYTPTNPLYKFRAIGFSFMHQNSNEDGLVSFEIKKSAEKVRSEETILIGKFQSFLNRPNILFKIAGVKATSEEQSVVNIYAEDQTNLRRFPATDLANVINQPHLKPNLDTLGISNVSAKVKPSPEQLKRYLENAPDGIHPTVWKQAQEDNPNPELMVPASVIGIDALKKRIHAQEMESAHHEARLLLIRDECSQYLQRCSNVGAEVVQMKRKESELSLRLLSVITKLEVARRGVSALQPEEIELSRRLQLIEDEINSPTEYKGRLMELLSHLRLQQVGGPSAKYTIDESSLHDIKDLLLVQQKSLKHLVETVKADCSNVALIGDSASSDPQTKPGHLDPLIVGKE